MGVYEDGTEPVELLDAFSDVINFATDLFEDAQVGREMKAEAIQDALKAGVRAFGNDFKSDIYERNLAKMDIEGIKAQRDDWNSVGDAKFGAGKEGSTRLTPAGETFEPDDKPKKRKRIGNRQFAS